ncbi:MAG: hypothetical protein ACRYFU_21545, partial [Janthinobacterium lividum]
WQIQELGGRGPEWGTPRALVRRARREERAHEVTQQMDGADGAWVYAYLHRKEGDTMNAAY